MRKPKNARVAALLTLATLSTLGGCGKSPESMAIARGKGLFAGRCASCHGADARGLGGLGANLRTSTVVAELTDEELLDYIKRGVEPTDTHAGMPPKGGWATLTDQHLLDIIAYIRTMTENTG